MRHRKLLLPSFHGERMRFYGNTMVEETRRVMDTWRQGEVFSLHPYTQEITLQVILRTVFGLDEGARSNELRDRLKKLLSRAENRATTIVMMYISANPHLETRNPWKFLLRERNRVDRMVYRQIAERRADKRTMDRKDVLAMLLEAKDDEG